MPFPFQGADHNDSNGRQFSALVDNVLCDVPSRLVRGQTDPLSPIANQTFGYAELRGKLSACLQIHHQSAHLRAAHSGNQNNSVGAPTALPPPGRHRQSAEGARLFAAQQQQNGAERGDQQPEVASNHGGVVAERRRTGRLPLRAETLNFVLFIDLTLHDFNGFFCAVNDLKVTDYLSL